MRGGSEAEALASVLMTPRWRGLHWVGTRLFDGVPSACAVARTWVGVQLGLAAPGVSPDVLYTVKLLTSELVANAITHSRSAGGVLLVRIGVSRPDHEPLVHVEVLDYGSDGHPVVRMSDGESGRGLFLVETLAVQWGTVEAESGRVVWFRVPHLPS